MPTRRSSRGLHDPARRRPTFAHGLAQALQNGRRRAMARARSRRRPTNIEALSAGHLQLSASKRARPAAADRAPASRSSPARATRESRRSPRLLAVGRLSSRDAAARRVAARTRYTPALVAAVKQLQADFGMKPDGVIGKDTHRRAQARARRTARASWRSRWSGCAGSQRDPPETRIDVNTAASFARLLARRAARRPPQGRRGEPDKPTPQLQAPFFRLVANPTWTVPKAIAEKELATRGQAWLASQRFRR